MNSRRQRGLALITAVFIVALVTTIAAYLSLGQQVWMRQAQSFLDRGQAGKVADGALQWAMHMLEDNAKKNPKVDEPGQDWAQQLPPLPVEGGAVAGRIRDAQGFFNLNNLVSGGQVNDQEARLFNRLLSNLRLDPVLAEAVIDWIDPDSSPRPGGAEDVYYLTLQPPYRPANRPLASVDELRLVRGFTREIVETLRPHVTALPTATPININFCSAEVLAALFNNDLTVERAKQLVEQRDDPKDRKPFRQPGELKTRANLTPPTDTTFEVKSEYFLVRIDTRFGRLTESRETLVRRVQGRVAVTWKVRNFLVPASGTDEADADPAGAEALPRGPGA
jgi:general secretion pathway protein K